MITHEVPLREEYKMFSDENRPLLSSSQVEWHPLHITGFVIGSIVVGCIIVLEVSLGKVGVIWLNYLLVSMILSGILSVLFMIGMHRCATYIANRNRQVRIQREMNRPFTPL